MPESNALHTIVFYLLASLTLCSAIYATFNRDFFRCALGFLVMLFSIAGLFLHLGSPFLAVVQIMVYAGGVTILILFGIMMIYRMSSASEARFTSAPITLAAFGVCYLLFRASSKVLLSFNSVAPKTPMLSSPALLGDSLIHQFLMAFDLLSVLLLVVLILCSALVGEIPAKGVDS